MDTNIKYNRAEKRAIAQGKGFNPTREQYTPKRVHVGIDADMNNAVGEYDTHTSYGSTDPRCISPYGDWYIYDMYWKQYDPYCWDLTYVVY